MPIYSFHKIVRDKLPQAYEELHQQAVIKKLGGQKLYDVLRQKLLEESAETPRNMSEKIAITDELADVLRVLKDMAAVAGIDFAAIEQADEAKTAKKGGFLDGQYIETLELQDDDTWNDYYRKEPLRFPEPQKNVDLARVIQLSDELAELGKIDRKTLLPGGRKESDSHHSFSLALIAYDICRQYCPELDANRVLRYALVHDLIEIITGDEDTLQLSVTELHAKHAREQTAWKTLEKRLRAYPELLDDLATYEALDSPEAATVYVLDKSCTIWTHFWDAGTSLHSRDMKTRAEIDTWYDTQLQKLTLRLKVMPPPIILDIFAESYHTMRSELFER